MGMDILLRHLQICMTSDFLDLRNGQRLVHAVAILKVGKAGVSEPKNKVELKQTQGS
jgi:hypothetical protein